VTAARKDGSVRIKLTISREEHPAMFEALASIRNPRRRTGRLKELVVKALTLEQVGATAALGPLLLDRCPSRRRSRQRTRKRRPSGHSSCIDAGVGRVHDLNRAAD
jgi:hypothetical protein